MKRRIISGLLCIAILLMLLPQNAFAGAVVYTGKCGDNLTWILDGSDGTLTISGTGDMYDHDPYVDDGENDNIGIPNGVWNGHSDEIKKVVFGDGVTKIGDYAFYKCKNIDSVTMPETVKTIGTGAFDSCTGLTSVNIPIGVETICEYAFGYCDSLATVSIPRSVTSIEELAFVSCDSLANIGVSVSNLVYTSFSGVLFDKQLSTLLCYPAGKEDLDYSMPDSVTTIASWAFYGCNKLEKLTIPNSVKTIEGLAFYGCSSLKYLSIPDSVTSIGYAAFEDCSGLTSVRISNSIDTLEDNLFSRCSSLQSVTIPFGVSSIGPYAFSECTSLASVYIPTSVTSIGWNAFDGCISLTAITIPESVTTIESGAFYNCTGLVSVTIPKNVEYLDCDMFAGCISLTAINVNSGNAVYASVDGVLFDKQMKTLICYPIGKSAASYAIPAGVTDIGEYAFWCCKNLKSVTIPSGAANIGFLAFLDCGNLKTVTIPKSIADISYGAFLGCCNLTDVYYGGSRAEWKKINIDPDENENLLKATIHCTDDALTAPTNVKVVADTATTMKVSWKAVSGATKYVVYRKEGSADWKKFTETTATSITLKTNLKHGYNYRFRIYAKNATKTSAGSAIVLLKFVPPTPTGLTISSTGVGQATIKWNAIPNIKGYCVYYKRADDTGYTYAGATTATSKTITGLTTGARYAFKIRAYVPATAGIYQGQNIFSEYCKYVSDEIVPAAPTGLKIASTGVGKAVLKWNKVSGAYAYCVYYKRADESGYSYAGATTDTSLTITGLTTGRRYAFKIRAYAKPTSGPKKGQNVFGPYCKYVSDAIPLAVPTGLKVSSLSAGNATITWGKTANAKGYCVYYKCAGDAGYTYAGTTTTTSMSFVGLNKGKQYAFKIRAYSGPYAGSYIYSAYTNYILATIPN